jgi:hypothetical protein
MRLLDTIANGAPKPFMTKFNTVIRVSNPKSKIRKTERDLGKRYAFQILILADDIAFKIAEPIVIIIE